MDKSHKKLAEYIGVPDEVYTDFDALRDSLKGKLMRLFGIGKPPKPNEWYWERLKFPADKLPCSDKSESNQNPSDPSPH